MQYVLCGLWDARTTTTTIITTERLKYSADVHRLRFKRPDWMSNVHVANLPCLMPSSSQGPLGSLGSRLDLFVIQSWFSFF